MTKEEFKKAQSIYEEMDMLSRWMPSIHHITNIGLYMRDGVNYDATTEIPVSEDLSKEIIDILNKRLSTLKNQFESL